MSSRQERERKEKTIIKYQMQLDSLADLKMGGDGTAQAASQDSPPTDHRHAYTHAHVLQKCCKLSNRQMPILPQTTHGASVRNIHASSPFLIPLLTLRRSAEPHPRDILLLHNESRHHPCLNHAHLEAQPCKPCSTTQFIHACQHII